jgi:integrase
VRQLAEAEKTREILNRDEVRELFCGEWSDKWDDYTYYVMNKLAACTGMRIGELLGLRGEFVFDNYINVCGQWTRYGYGDTKTHKSRLVPLPHIVRQDLAPLLEKNGTGYVFSADGGAAPVKRLDAVHSLASALSEIKISSAEQKRRGLTFHAWRHFFNTTLRMANVSDSKVKSVTGHLTDGMTEHYTHYNNLEFIEVQEVQNNLFTATEKIALPQAAKPE